MTQNDLPALITAVGTMLYATACYYLADFDLVVGSEVDSSYVGSYFSSLLVVQSLPSLYIGGIFVLNRKRRHLYTEH